jgi:spermidine synthase
MKPPLEELDVQPTPMGELVLRRRWDPALERDVFEVKLGDAFLMSSAFTAGEVRLAELGLAAVGAPAIDVVVGGLGLGHTAAAALDDPRVRSVTVIETLDAVIGWHRRGLTPLGERLTADPRCRFVRADFFALAAAAERGFDPGAPPRRAHAILLDIDHSPRHVLAPGHAAFYTPAGLRPLRTRMHPGGVLAIWSNDPPDAGFTGTLATVFATARAHVVTFANPLQERPATNTVYVAQESG